jgi:hypothetical protein
MNEGMEKPKAGGGTELKDKIWRYEDYLAKALEKKLEAEGLREKLDKFGRDIGRLRTLEGLDRFADDWNIPRYIENKND